MKKKHTPRPLRGPHAAVLPPMPLSFEEALGDYLKVKPSAEPVAPLHKERQQKPVRKRKVAKKR